MIPRSPEQVAAVFGVWKAGGAYVPIDPEYPEERKQYIISDSGTALLLTVHGAIDQVPDHFKGEVLALEDIQEQDASPVQSLSAPEDLAYIIYVRDDRRKGLWSNIVPSAKPFNGGADFMI